MSLVDLTWTGAKGAAKFAAAVASGDMADSLTMETRRAVCRACPSLRLVKIPGATEASHWCGEPLVDRMGEPLPTCGCLCAAKTAVGSERCPQGRW